MKLILPLVLAMILSSCAFFSKKVDNSAAINKYENKMRSIASSGRGQLPLPPGYSIYKADLTIVGPDGDVILFYKDGSEIVITECDFYKSQFPMDSREKCAPKGEPRQVSITDFKNRLKAALRIHKFATLGSQQAEELKNYREGVRQNPSAGDLVKQREEVQAKILQIEAFMGWQSKEDLGADKLAELEDLQAKLSNGSKFSEAVDNLNKVIDELIDDVIGSPEMSSTLSYSNDKEGIRYSLLRSYIRPYLDLSKAPYEKVNSGTFMMGSSSSEKERHDDEVQHSVTITKDFEIGATEVTQFEWFDLMGYNPSYHKEEHHCPGAHMVKDGVSLCPLFPVERVAYDIEDSEEDVKGFIKARNRRAESEGEPYTYRLPTEAEWELAARGGTKTTYSFGDNPSDLSNYAWYSENSQGQTQAAATKAPNPIGLYDVHGNVWEWVEDWYGDLSSSSVTDPTGSRSGSYRVIRGGGWSSDARVLRSANRNSVRPGGRDNYLGFRLVRTPK